MPINTQDTHDPVVQASAYRLLQYLFKAYPNISMFNSEHLTPRASFEQSALVTYLNSLVDAAEPALVSLPQDWQNMPIIKSVIEIIHIIHYLPEEKLSFDQKNAIYKQILSIASICPDIESDKWSNDQKHWSVNRFYNGATGKVETLMTPPGEALNLLCRALLDDDRHFSNSEDQSKERALRIETFYVHLLSLQTQIDNGQLEKCSAGLQHDLLFMLSSFLDKPRHEGGKLIHLPVEKSALVLEALSLFVEGTLNNEVLLDWIRWSMTPSSLEECPLTSRLRQCDEDWQKKCMEHTCQYLESFGVKLAEEIINGYIENIETIPIPTSSNPMIAVIMEIFQMKLLTVSDDFQHPVMKLIQLRNNLIERFKIMPLDLDSVVCIEAIKRLFDVLNLISSLNDYFQDEVLFIGIDTENKAVLANNSCLIELLISSFERAELEDSLPRFAPELEALTIQYIESKKLATGTKDFIGNIFTLLADENTKASALMQIAAMDSHDSDFHPLALNDEILALWQEKSRCFSDAGEVINMTPYAVNRLLLHALLVPREAWTPLYSSYLTHLIKWLSHSPPPVFQKSYMAQFLANLSIISLAAFTTEKLIFSRDSLFPIYKDFTAQQCDFLKHSLLPYFLLRTGERELFLTAIQPALGTIIYDGNVLYNLFSMFTIKQLTKAHRTQILTELDRQQKFSSIFVGDAQGLIALLKILRNEERTQFLQAIKVNLPKIIVEYDDLRELFYLPTSILSSPHRVLIVDAVKDNIPNIIQNGEGFADLFDIPIQKFNVELRQEIWNVWQGNLSFTAPDDMYLFCALFELSYTKFNVEQRANLWDKVKGSFLVIINDSDALIHLLGTKKLSSDQIDYILDVMKGSLPNIITDGSQLIQLLKIETLNPEQRSHILDVLKEKLPELIENSIYFFTLLSIAHSVENQLLILDVLKEKLPELIENSTYLFTLLSITHNVENQLQILDAIKVSLPNIITNGSQLIELLKLERHKPEQRSHILDVLKEKLPGIIKNRACFLNLLEIEALGAAKQLQALEIMKPYLRSIINNETYLFALLERLNIEPQSPGLLILKPALTTLIQVDPTIFHRILGLNPLYFDLIKENLPTIAPRIIQNGSQLFELLNLLSTEQQRFTIKALEAILPKLIQQESELFNDLFLFNPDIFDLILDLPTHLEVDPAEMARVLQDIELVEPYPKRRRSLGLFRSGSGPEGESKEPRPNDRPMGHLP